MTRRRIVFKNKNEVWVSPEFNGDKKEFAERGMTSSHTDGCRLNFEENLVEHFASITNAMQFRIACHDAMREYHSALGDNLETEGPFLLKSEEEMPKADKVIVIDIEAAQEKYGRYCSCVNNPIAWSKWCEVIMTLD